MNTDKTNDPIDRVKQELDAAVDNLDEQTLARLRAIRKQAIASRDSKQVNWLQRPWLLPAGGFATAAIVFAIVGLVWMGPGEIPSKNLAGQDMEILLAQDHLDLYTDLEFFRWLDQTNAG